MEGRRRGSEETGTAPPPGRVGGSEAAGWRDYSSELRVTRNPALRYLYTGLGLVLTGIGFVGVFVPGLPTTVWLLLATFFFARSSPRFYNWIMNHRVFGPFIRDWRAGRGIPLRAKLVAVLTIALTITLSAVLIPNLAARVVLILVGLCVSTYLLTRPTKRLS